MRNPLNPLRLASILSLLLAAGHTLGGLKSSWSPSAPSAVFTSMQTFHFSVGSLRRSYFDFYRGFGFLLSVYLLSQAVLLWQLGNLARADRSLARPLVWTFLVASLAIGVLTWRFLFATPLYFDIGLTALLGWSVFTVQAS